MMVSDISGRGDPIRTLELLWGRDTGTRRGPKPRYALAEVVAVAVEIADREGIDALTTRRVAQKLGISPMSLYTYVPGKEELIDLMLDRVIAEGMDPRPVFVPAEWRANLTFIARSLWSFYLRHPWVLEFATHRPVLGPNTLLAADIGFSAIDGIGLDELEINRAFVTLTNFVHGAVRDAARESMVNQATGMTDDEWWGRVSPFLEGIDFSPYPTLSRVGPVAGAHHGAHEPPATFAFGLELLLDGLTLYLERKHKVDGNAPSA